MANVERAGMRILIGLVFLVTAAPAMASLPWVIEPGKTLFSFSYLDQQFDEFFRAGEGATLPAEIEQNTVQMSFGYGLSDMLSLDFRTGYTETRFAPSTRGDFSGRDDSMLGLRWRFVDEHISSRKLPTLTLRAAMIVAGDYEASSIGNPHSPGDGASGVAISLLAGKMFEQGWLLSSELGYRNYESPVPSDLFFSLGAYYRLSAKVTFSSRYLYEAAQSGVEIGQPTVTPDDFDRLKEIQEIVNLGVTYDITPRVNVGLDLARSFDGRNTGKKNIAVFRWGISF